MNEAQSARALDVICIGRAAVDLYGEQIGARLEDVTTFARYLGGSPANTAVGCARLGLRAAMLTRVGDEQNGRFVLDSLQQEGVDVSQVRIDPQRLTALVFLSIRSRDEFPLLFYRDHCADMALDTSDVDPRFIATSASVLISGTHLSQPGPYAACKAAIDAARAAGARVALDIDFRPVLWGLAPLSDGATRFVEASSVTARLQPILSSCDLIVGTEDEFRIAAGAANATNAIQALRQLSQATLVLKRGASGCTIYPPGGQAAPIEVPGFPIEVFNVLGAGDAFMAGFLSGWLRDELLAECGRRANACGALVVSRHGCAPAIPSKVELEYFLQNRSTTSRLREDATLNRLHRATTRRPPPPWIAALAFDHRSQLEQLASELQAPLARIAPFKQIVARAAQRACRLAGPFGGRCGLLLDDRYGADLLPALDDAGWWIARPVEQPGSRPLRFENARNVHAMLREWPVTHVAKCLVSLSADDDSPLMQQQLQTLRDLQAACEETGRELLLEVIPPGASSDAPASDDALVRAVSAIITAGITPDWWKLAAPVHTHGWQQLTGTIQRADPYCRGVLVLGLDAPIDSLAERLALAATKPICRGFAVGRTIFGNTARAWFKGTVSDDDVVEAIAQRYLQLVHRFAAARQSWQTRAANSPVIMES